MLEIVTPPAALAVSIEEVEAHSRLIGDGSEDDLVEALIGAATAALEGHIGRALINRTLRLTVDCFTRYVALPASPVVSVTSVKYYDIAGVLRTLDSGAYTLLDRMDAPRVVPAQDESWPSTRDFPASVQIEFVAGYGATSAAVPENLRLALLKMVASHYDYRESIGTAAMVPIPEGVSELINSERRWSL